MTKLAKYQSSFHIRYCIRIEMVEYDGGSRGIETVSGMCSGATALMNHS